MQKATQRAIAEAMLIEVVGEVAIEVAIEVMVERSARSRVSRKGGDPGLAASRAKKKARAAKAGLYRQLVLEAAERVFARKGYDEARIGEIAEQSGISLQTLYSVFPGKADIYRAIQESGDEALHAGALDAARKERDPLAALLAGLRSTTLYFLEHPDFLRMRLHGGFTWGTEAMAASNVGRTESWRAAFELLLGACELCVNDGLFVGRPPELIARTILSMQQVELAHWLQGGMEGDLARVARDLEAQVERAFRVDLDGMEGRSDRRPS